MFKQGRRTGHEGVAVWVVPFPAAIVSSGSPPKIHGWRTLTGVWWCLTMASSDVFLVSTSGSRCHRLDLISSRENFSDLGAMASKACTIVQRLWIADLVIHWQILAVRADCIAPLELIIVCCSLCQGFDDLLPAGGDGFAQLFTKEP